MISTVTIYGTMLETYKEKYRFISCESGDPLHNDSVFFKVPLLHWSQSSSNANPLLAVPAGKKVVIKGRLSKSEDFELLVIVEMVKVI